MIWGQELLSYIKVGSNSITDLYDRRRIQYTGRDWQCKSRQRINVKEQTAAERKRCHPETKKHC